MKNSIKLIKILLVLVSIFLTVFLVVELISLNKLNNLRELLQIIILRIMHETNQFKHLAFVGGTCLRILYNLNRFSEDLDFSLIQPGYKFSAFVKSLETNLKKSGFFVEYRQRTTVGPSVASSY